MCVTLRQKVLVVVLFDLGARIEEFLNVRCEDVSEVKGDVPYFRIMLRGQFSKTAGRTVSLLWRESTPIVRQWCEENKGRSLTEPFFPATYAGCRKVLAKLGKRALGKRVTPHLFRHSSATYYASRGFDYFQLCKRYGWSIGSAVPHDYIHRSGIKEKEVVEKFQRESMRDLHEELDRVKEESKLKAEKIADLQMEVQSAVKGREVENLRLREELDRTRRDVSEIRKSLQQVVEKRASSARPSR